MNAFPPVKEHPILFSGPMVRAILDGTKTQTRRVVTQRNSIPDVGRWSTHEYDFERARADQGLGTGGYLKVPFRNLADEWEANPDDDTVTRVRAKWKVGDRLWVRETWNGTQGEGLAYRATEPRMDGDPWKPSIHMPRWASRITLEVVGIRVERLQDISEEDAMAEGIRHVGWRKLCMTLDAYDYRTSPPYDERRGYVESWDDPRACYADLWELINGPGSWGANPWVWVIGFKPVEVKQ